MKKNDFQGEGSDPSQDLLDSLDSTEIKTNKKGCLINFLSILFGFIALSIGVGFQVLLFDEGGPEAIGAGIVIAFTFSSYYFSKKSLKKYFNKPKV